MRTLLLFACLSYGIAPFARAEVTITRSASGWALSNGEIRLALARSPRAVSVESLRRTDGAEWAVPGAPLTAFLDGAGDEYRFTEDAVSDLAHGGKQLALQFKSEAGGLLSLLLRLYPTGAVIEFAAQLENRGPRLLPLLFRIDPLCLTLKTPAGGFKPYSALRNQHGFHPAGDLSAAREFPDWLVLANQDAGESALIGGEPGLGILGWKANTQPSSAGTLVHAGSVFAARRRNAGQPSAYEVEPGEKVEIPIAFLALAKGDADEVGNQTFRYLKRYVFLQPVANAPLAAYCVWLTEANSEETLLDELKFARRVGFDVFYHDATWVEGASIIPGMNDWSKGLGTFRESREKFPHGLKNLSDAVRAAGMKFGLWVDPGNVDASRVASGEIPQDWLAMIDGKPLGGRHPSLSPTNQLCLGNPKVVEWLKQQLSGVIGQWNLEWIKWDPSATRSGYWPPSGPWWPTSRRRRLPGGHAGGPL